MKVSVLIITYNHEKFIAQALDSALMQKTSFDYEIVIGEDCSSDQTRKIVRQYHQKYPDKIRVLLPAQNLGMLKNFVNTFRACKGQYIALLEGDDYWTAPDKLQKQADFLDSHLECSTCFHNVNVIYSSSSQKSHPFHRNQLKKYFTLRDIVSKHFIPTCSTMFRSGLFKDFPEWYYALSMGDWPLHVLNAEHGTAGYINELMGTYRVHEGGQWSLTGRITILKNTIHAATTIDQYLEHKFHTNLNNLIAACHCEIATILFHEKQYKGASFHAHQARMLAQPYNIVVKALAMKIILETALFKFIDPNTYR